MFDSEDPQMSALKIPPHSVEAESAVLGCILRNPELLHHAEVSKEDFYRCDHRVIYGAMRKAESQGREPDVVVVGEVLERDGELENIGGIAYLMGLTESIGTTNNLNSYAEVVRERAMLRSGISVAHEIAQTGFDGDLTGMQDLMGKSLTLLSNDPKDLWSPDKSVIELVERVDRVARGEAPGLPFGVGSMDSRWKSGMKPGDLIVMGARPGMGKTAVALNMALKQKCPVGFVSLEMPHDQLTQRCLAIKSQVPFNKIDLAEMSEAEWKRFGEAATCYSKNGLHVFDRGGATIGQVTQAAMKLKHQHDIGLLIIDYVQLVNGEGNNRNDEIGAITRQLKSLAKRLRIPIIILSQLNRKVEERVNKRPMLSDLRESGQIEQDADMIIFLYRDGVYNNVADDSIEFIVEKVRNGPIGFAKSGWDGELMMLRGNYL